MILTAVPAAATPTRLSCSECGTGNYRSAHDTPSTDVVCTAEGCGHHVDTRADVVPYLEPGESLAFVDGFLSILTHDDAEDAEPREATATEHTILAAITVETDRWEVAEWVAGSMLTVGRDGAEFPVSWWIAEDPRTDGSDCDSAVFCKPGRQAEATALLRAHGLA